MMKCHLVTQWRESDEALIDYCCYMVEGDEAILSLDSPSSFITNLVASNCNAGITYFRNSLDILKTWKDRV